MELLSREDMCEIADRLAGTDGTLDESVAFDFGVRFEDLEKIMAQMGHAWDYDKELWVRNETSGQWSW